MKEKTTSFRFNELTKSQIKELATRLKCKNVVVVERAINALYADTERIMIEELKRERDRINTEIDKIESKS